MYNKQICKKNIEIMKVVFVVSLKEKEYKTCNNESSFILRV